MNPNHNSFTIDSVRNLLSVHCAIPFEFTVNPLNIAVRGSQRTRREWHKGHKISFVQSYCTELHGFFAYPVLRTNLLIIYNNCLISFRMCGYAFKSFQIKSRHIMRFQGMCEVTRNIISPLYTAVLQLNIVCKANKNNRDSDINSSARPLMLPVPDRVRLFAPLATTAATCDE